jgi:PAS domain S-box-containing protein
MATRKQKAKKRAPSPKRDKPVRKRKPGGPKAENPKSAVTRLKAELREALAQQTATADILRTISQSPTDLQPVLDAVVGAARRFCGAPDALILLREGGETFVAAHDGKLTASLGLRRPVAITSLTGRAMIEGRTLQIDDISALDPVADAEPLALARQHRWRASAAAPMMREGEAIGCIVLRKPEPGSLAPHQVQLLETFAAQAVIAIENVRLFTELRQRTDDLTESLEYQTATSELLEVISRSTTDVQPVLDTMLASAARLCGANSGGVAIRRGAGVSYVASFGQTAEFDQMWRTHEFIPDEATVTGRVLLTRQVVHVADMAEELDHSLMESVTLGGMRTALGVPLLREGEPIGVIMLNRDRVEPFTDRQIALVRTFADQAVIAMENARLLGELREALDQQTATTEVLQVINSSPGELEPVFEAILEKAMQACHASFGGLWIFEAGRYVAAALHKVPKAYADFLRTTTLVPGPGSGPHRFLHGERSVIQNVDLADEELYRAGDPQRRALVDLGGARTALQVPLCTDDTVIGVVTIYRQEVRAFDDRQSALLQSFAAQAVIAIQNARLLGELRASLEQQTATSDVLRTISRSSVNLEAVLETLVETVARLCRADHAYMFRGDNDLYQLVAAHGLSDEAREFIRVHPLASDRGTVIGRTAMERRAIHIVDVLKDPDYTYMEGQKIAGYRTILGIPLMRENTLVGLFNVSRTRVEPFTDKEIELATSFADQAVIAIENARLFEELRDRQAELRVTFDNMGDGVAMFDDEPRLVAWNRNFEEIIGLPDVLLAERPSYADYLRMLAERGEFGTENVEAELASRLENTDRELRLERTSADGTVIEVRRNAVPGGGFVLIYSDVTEQRKAEAAIRAARDDAEAALERQTATADILKVIAGSPSDVQPVLDAIAVSARRLVGADNAGVILRDQSELRVASHDGLLPAELGLRVPLDRTTGMGRAISDGRTVHIPDVLALDPVDFARGQELARTLGFRAVLAVPMLQDGLTIGAILLRRSQPGEFTQQQIELLETFAAQAVIAIENVRLFTGLRESLEQQTALAEILQVISQSPTNVEPVLKAVVGAARRFCGADDAMVVLREETEQLLATHEGSLQSLVGNRLPLDRSSVTGRATIDGQTFHVPDVALLDSAEHSMTIELTRRTGIRALLAAPMLREGHAIGCVLLRRPQPGAFTPRQIELLETFAAQAVIAIENVRLFTELRETLEQQTASAEILQVISQSPTNVQPVFDVIADSALRLLNGWSIVLWRYDGERLRVGAIRGGNPGSNEAVRGRLDSTPVEELGFVRDAIRERAPKQIVDVENEDIPLAMRYIARERGWRANIAVPMLSEGQLVGLFSLSRVEAGAFSESEIRLLQTFADQAVIAVQNVRLFTELREALEQQTASAEILQVISQSPTDVAPVLTAVAKAAIRFCNSPDAVIWLRDGDETMRVAHEGPLPTDIGARRPLSRNSAVSLAVAESRTIHYPDLLALDSVKFADAQKRARESGYRAALAAPMLREGQAIGAIVLRKQEAVAYTERQIELLEAFAAQAVIAIENVRLFTELRDSLERLKAAQANLIQSEKMASLGQLTAGIAHEIKNPLNFVNNFAILSVDLLDELKEAAGSAFDALDKDKRAEVDETMELLTGNLGKIAEHGKRADGIVKSMLSHSRGGTGDWAPSDINALVDEALNLAYHGARAQDKEFNVTLERDFEKAGQPIEVVPQDVTRVFLNLFGNGFYAANKRRLGAKEAGFRPTIKVTTREAGDGVEVKVRDNGTGMPPEVREKLFQPFFTTKPTGEGTGLGLSISYDIVTQQHGGTIAVESVPGEFTEFTVRLPRARRVVLAEKVR